MTAGHPRRWQRLSWGVGIALGSAIVLVGGAELLLRAAGYGRGPARYFDPQIGFRFLPDQTRSMGRRDGTPLGSVAFNELGLRGPVWAADRAPGERRIACLGDSFTFGWGEVHDGETWPALLQERLRRREGPVRWTTMNFGVPGYNLWNSTRMYRRVARPFEPDLVLVGFFANDVAPRDKGPRHTESGPLYWAGRTALAEAFHRLLRRRISYFDNPDDDATADARRTYRAHQAVILTNPGAEVAAPFWERAMGELGELVTSVRADGGRVVLLGFPQRSQVAHVERSVASGRCSAGEAMAEVNGPQERLAAEARRLGVVWLDLFDAFCSVGLTAFGDLDSGHPAPVGYSAAAGAIFGHLEELGLLRGS